MRDVGPKLIEYRRVVNARVFVAQPAVDRDAFGAQGETFRDLTRGKETHAVVHAELDEAPWPQQREQRVHDRYQFRPSRERPGVDAHTGDADHVDQHFFPWPLGEQPGRAPVAAVAHPPTAQHRLRNDLRCSPSTTAPTAVPLTKMV